MKRYSESKHFDSRFRIWLTDRFDFVYENLESETLGLLQYKTLDDLRKDCVEEAIDTIEIIERWKEDNTETLNLRSTE